MSIGRKIKVVNGYNSDLIGKTGVIVGESGANFNVVMDHIKGQTYEIPAITCHILPIIDKNPKPIAEKKEDLEAISQQKELRENRESVESKTGKMIEDFTLFCQNNPALRFWQALSVWSESRYVNISNEPCKTCKDTFHFKGRKA